MAKNKRSESPDENEGRLELSVIAADSLNLYKLFEKLFGNTYKNQIVWLPTWSNSSTSKCRLKGRENLFPLKNIHQERHKNIVYTGSKLGIIQGLFAISIKCGIYTMEYYPLVERISSTWSNMDEYPRETSY